MKFESFLPLDEPSADWLPDEVRWVLPNTHLSVSQLQKFLTCERAYQMEYILGRKKPPTSFLAFGSAVHSAIEWCLSTKIKSDDAMPAEDTAAYFAEMAWPNQIESEGGLGEMSWEKNDTFDGLRITGAQMVALYVEKVVPRIEPRELEMEFLHDVEGVPIPVKGRVDIVQKGTRPAIDLKTQNKAAKFVLPNWVLQGRVYQLVEPRPVDWHVLTKQVTPQCITSADHPELLQSFSEEQADNTKEFVRRIAWKINEFYARYGPDEPWDWTGITKLSACGYCPHKGTCPGWEGA